MTRFIWPAFALALLAGPAQAHVTVQPRTAEPGTEQTLRFVVGHGCAGQPTTALRIELPAEITGVRPEAKPGWTLAAEPGAHAVTWRGALAPHEPGEFQLQARLPSRTGLLAFTAIQTCGELTVRWDQIMAPGTEKPERPAPTILVAKGGDAPAPAADDRRPKDVERIDGGLADTAGRPLYVFDYDTMQGMSHCVEQCAATWPPLKASPGAAPIGDWGLIYREDGAAQWTYKTKPLYTYSKDVEGAPPAGDKIVGWRRAR